MKKIIYDITLVIFTTFFICCNYGNVETNLSINSEGKRATKDSLIPKTDTLKGQLKQINQPIPESVIAYYKREFDKQLKKGEYYLFLDKQYISFMIISQKNYQAALEWKVFLIKGQVELSKDDEAEYDFYGVYKEDSVYTYDFLAQPVEIVTELENYIVTPNSIAILGKQWDLGGGNGAEPPPEKEILLEFP